MARDVSTRTAGIEAAAAGDPRYSAAIVDVSRIVLTQLAYLGPRIGTGDQGSRVAVRVNKIRTHVPLVFLGLDNCEHDPAAQDQAVRVLEAMSMEMAGYIAAIKRRYIAAMAVDGDVAEECARVDVVLDIDVPLITPPAPVAPVPVTAPPPVAPSAGLGPVALLIIAALLVGAVLATARACTGPDGDPAPHALSYSIGALP